MMFMTVTKCKVVTRISRIVNNMVRVVCRMVKLVTRIIKESKGGQYGHQESQRKVRMGYLDRLVKMRLVCKVLIGICGRCRVLLK